LSAIRRHGIACVALPTCGLALAAAERYIPTLIGRLEDLGYGNERVSIRTSGCPNSCSRAPVAEVGIFGRAPGKHNLYVGGEVEGSRLSQFAAEVVLSDELPETIGRLFDRWRKERADGEAFGDWAIRDDVESLRQMTQAEQG